MSEQAPASPPASDKNPKQLDPAFFACVNEFLEVTNRQAKEQGLKRISMASIYAAARFNSHVYLAHEGDVPASRKDFLDYMTNMYRRMLNEHLDALGAERGLDVGVSELAGEYAAAGFQHPAAPVNPASGSAAK